MSTQDVLAHHLGAFSEGVDSIMSDYADRSVLFTPDGPVVGHEAIRDFLHSFLANSPDGLLQAMTVLRQDIHGEFAYIHWKADPFIPFASDTFVIRGGKILAQSFAMFPPAAS